MIIKKKKKKNCLKEGTGNMKKSCDCAEYYSYET